MRLDTFIQDTMQISGRVQGIANEVTSGALDLSEVMENLAKREVYAIEVNPFIADRHFEIVRLGLEPEASGGRIRLELRYRVTRDGAMWGMIRTAAIVAGLLAIGGLCFQIGYDQGLRSAVVDTQLPTR